LALGVVEVFMQLQRLQMGQILPLIALHQAAAVMAVAQAMVQMGRGVAGQVVVEFLVIH
jgi:hypothetical protein